MGFSKVQNMPVIKDQEVRGQLSTIFLDAPNSGITVGEKSFVVARFKLALFQFFTFTFPSCWTLKIDDGFWPNLKYLNKFGYNKGLLN